MKINTTFKSGFSIIEVMIGIFIFALWLVAILALLTSSLSVNELNKNSIIAGQLAREQIELVRNIRDTNYKKLKLWNQHNPESELTITDKADPSKVFLPDEYYFIENNYTNWEILVELLWLIILEWPEHLGSMNTEYGLCFDSVNRYIKCSPSETNNTKFYKYLKVEQAEDELGNDIQDAFILISKVIWYKRWYHELEIKTIITDWRRI